MATRKIAFARINRRKGQTPLEMKPFAEDMRLLAASHRTEARGPAAGPSVTRTWFAADMVVVPDGDFMTGTVGFSEKQEHREFDRNSWSWLKGPTHRADAGTEQTVVPFAVDLRDANRWVAFATSGRMQAPTCATGLARVLKAAVEAARLLPAEWDVDLVTSRKSVEEWLIDHPDVFELSRTVKHTNPGLDLDRDRSEMRALDAGRKTEQFRARYGQTLDSSSDTFYDKLDGIQDGNLSVVLKARGGSSGAEQTFSSENRPDAAQVEDFGSDLEAGIDVALRAVRYYAEGRDDERRRVSS